MIRRTTYVLIDTSLAMRNRHRIAEKSHRRIINEMMSFVVSNVLPSSVFDRNAEFEACIAVMTFSSNGVEWCLPKTKVDDLVHDDYAWTPINRSQFGGTSAIGDAIDAVMDDVKLSREDDVYESAPNIVVITNGQFDSSFNKVLDYTERKSENYNPQFFYSYKAVIDVNADEVGLRNIEKFVKTNANYGTHKYADSGMRYCYKVCRDDLDDLFYHACHTQTT